MGRCTGTRTAGSAMGHKPSQLRVCAPDLLSVHCPLQYRELGLPTTIPHFDLVFGGPWLVQRWRAFVLFVALTTVGACPCDSPKRQRSGRGVLALGGLRAFTFSAYLRVGGPSPPLIVAARAVAKHPTSLG